MESILPFVLEPLSPADRAAQRERELEVVRNANRRARQAAREAGGKQIAVTLSRESVAELDRLKKQGKFRNRDQVLARIVDGLRARPDMMKELGL